MEIRTHLSLDPRLSGHPVALADGFARVRLHTTAAMCADERGLVHGGFVFSAADHAAMLAVNDPHVVLGAADSRFLAPVSRGQVVEFEGRLEASRGRRRLVKVTATAHGKPVFAGTFTCFVLAGHVLDRTDQNGRTCSTPSERTDHDKSAEARLGRRGPIRSSASARHGRANRAEARPRHPPSGRRRRMGEISGTARLSRGWGAQPTPWRSPWPVKHLSRCLTGPGRQGAYAPDAVGNSRKTTIVPMWGPSGGPPEKIAGTGGTRPSTPPRPAETR